MRDLSPVVYRGEADGALRPASRKPFFFAEDYGQARLYAGAGTHPIECVIQGKRVLDLTAPNVKNPGHMAVVKALQEQFDDWTCRYSGEPRDPWSYLEAGDLYDYEGTGSGGRWNALFDIALNELGYDAVRILDCTDGTNHQASPVWVTLRSENIRPATLGESLAAHLSSDDPEAMDAMDRFLKQTDSNLLERINRLIVVDDEYRLDLVQEIIPEENLLRMGHDPDGHQIDVWRSLPVGGEIRPGDWIALSADYAKKHLREREKTGFEVKRLRAVRHDDIYWAGTDENEFFYLPAAWRKTAYNPIDYLRSLTPEQVRILCDGEGASITRHSQAIELLERHILDTFDHDACGIAHGPEHWDRVCYHSEAVARHLGVDPLIGHVFALVHDSQRQDEGLDPGHGPRAAQFIVDHAETLFGFLTPLQRQMLAHACELHSDGHIHSHAYAMVCWDADRLDLWRVGIEPAAHLLCTEHARDERSIGHAREQVSDCFVLDLPAERGC
jgi:hypothetical protein